MRVLVVGGAGFIGSVTVERLLSAGTEVVVFDDFSTGNRGAVSPGAALVEGRMQDTAKLVQVMRDHKIDTVMHLAAFIEVGESVANPVKYFENNVLGAHSVMSAMIEADVRRMVFSSTAAVYGMPETVPIDETAPIAPINPYGLSKRMVEEMLAWHGKAYGLEHVILRYFNACGASESYGEAHTPESHLIPNVLLTAAGTRESVQIFGNDYPTPDGTCIRDYVHVEDLADAHIAAMGYLTKGGASVTLNLGNGVGHSVMEVVEAVELVTGRLFNVDICARRPGDAETLVASSARAHDVLGWTPKKPDLETIVGDAWRFMQQHPQGYAK